MGSDRANMIRTSGADSSRLSISSAPSSSSQGSGTDDIESLGDVYVWGEVWTDVAPSDGQTSTSCSKIDVLIPKPLESDVVLDVNQIVCGSRHVALTTRQGRCLHGARNSVGALVTELMQILVAPSLLSQYQ